MNPWDTAKFWIDSGMDPEGFELKPISEGYGVFATKDFLRGDFLLECRGQLVTVQEASDLEKRHQEEQKACCVYHLEHYDICVVCTSPACHVNHSTGSGVNCQLRLVTHQNTLYLCLFASKEIQCGSEILLDKGFQVLNRQSQHTDCQPTVGINRHTWIALGLGAVGGGVALVAPPMVLNVLGYTTAGIAAKSVAAGMMSSSAIANGGGVSAGSLVALLQSAGAAGMSTTASTVIGTTAAAVTGGFTKLCFWLKGKKSNEGSNLRQTGSKVESDNNQLSGKPCDRVYNMTNGDGQRRESSESSGGQDVHGGESKDGQPYNQLVRESTHQKKSKL